MTIYILIVITYVTGQGLIEFSGQSVLFQEFSSKEKCELARNKIMSSTSQIKAECVEK